MGLNYGSRDAARTACESMESPRVRPNSTAASTLQRRLSEAEASVEQFLSDIEAREDSYVTWKDMVQLAATYGVSRVAKRPLSVAGLSMPISPQRAILINEEDTPVRQRFTLAHEVAHLFLDADTTRQVWLRSPNGTNERVHDTLESFCNDLAARILMPRPWLSRDLTDKSPMPSLLLQLADKYGVSLQAFCIRAVEFLGGPYHIVEWSQDRTRRGTKQLHMRWPKPAAARGLSSLLPRKTTMHSPVGELFHRCLSDGTAAYSGEIVLETKKEAVEMRASFVQRGVSPTILAVTRRLRSNRDTFSHARVSLP